MMSPKLFRICASRLKGSLKQCRPVSGHMMALPCNPAFDVLAHEITNRLVSLELQYRLPSRLQRDNFWRHRRRGSLNDVRGHRARGSHILVLNPLCQVSRKGQRMASKCLTFKRGEGEGSYPPNIDRRFQA